MLPRIDRLNFVAASWSSDPAGTLTSTSPAFGFRLDSSSFTGTGCEVLGGCSTPVGCCSSGSSGTSFLGDLGAPQEQLFPIVHFTALWGYCYRKFIEEGCSKGAQKGEAKGQKIRGSDCLPPPSYLMPFATATAAPGGAGALRIRSQGSLGHKGACDMRHTALSQGPWPSSPAVPSPQEGNWQLLAAEKGVL